jgi:hypothetical protein
MVTLSVEYGRRQKQSGSFFRSVFIRLTFVISCATIIKNERGKINDREQSEKQVVLLLQVLVRSVLLGNQADYWQGYVSGGNVGKVQMLEAQYDDAGGRFLQGLY